MKFFFERALALSAPDNHASAAVLALGKARLRPPTRLKRAGPCGSATAAAADGLAGSLRAAASA